MSIDTIDHFEQARVILYHLITSKRENTVEVIWRHVTLIYSIIYNELINFVVVQSC